MSMKRNNNNKLSFMKNKKVIASIIFVVSVAVIGVLLMLFNDEGEVVGASSDRNQAYAELKSENDEYKTSDKFKVNILIKSGESEIEFKVYKDDNEILSDKLGKKDKYEKELSFENEKQGEYTYRVEVIPTFGEKISKELVISISDKKNDEKEDTNKDKDSSKDKSTSKDKTENKVNDKKPATNTATDDKKNSQSNTSGGDAKTKWSSAKVQYKTGDVVEYGGESYKCIAGHESQATWNPSLAQTLWKRVD